MAEILILAEPFEIRFSYHWHIIYGKLKPVKNLWEALFQPEMGIDNKHVALMKMLTF